MQIKANKKRFLICLLLCSLFLTTYISVLNTNGIFFPNLNLWNDSSISGESEPSSMNGAASSWHMDAMTAAETLMGFFNASNKQSRSLDAKNNFNILAAVIAAQSICLIYAARRSDRICTQFCAINITIFLHKKDGMK